MKTCSKCKETKNSNCFCKCRKSKDGLQSQCKTCKIESVKKSPSTKKYKKSKEYALNYYHKTKVARNISRRIRQSLSKTRKSKSWTLLVEFSLEELKVHLEKLFTSEMSWDNYGKLWHIDHIRPIASFNIQTEGDEEFKKCWSLDNLQPLLAIDNLKKGKKFL